MTLRTRLVAAVIVIAFLGLVAAGAATLASLRSYLVDRVDGDITSGAVPFLHAPDGDNGQGDGDNQNGGAPQLPSAFYVERYTPSGTPVVGLSAPLGDQSPPDLPALTPATVQRLGTAPFTVGSQSGSGSWRVVVRTDPLGYPLAVAESLDQVDSTVHRLLLLEIAVGLVVLVLMTGAGLFVVRRSLRPLGRVEETAAAIAAGDLTRRVPDADDRTEVGRVATALNVMLARIEQAFDAQAASEQQARASEEQARASEEQLRRFVADASHELRTPITSIRGFAELHRMGAVEDDELERLMRRIEGESTRMGGLVEDLLTLARLDARRPLQRAPVDLAALAADAVTDLRALAPDRTVTLQATDPGAAVVSGDEPRLRQVIANLTGNAVRYTPAGTPLEIAVESAGEQVTLAVVDHGPGIPAEHRDRVFGRFYRVDTARSRADGGSGLGLAIVAEIVAAHGGTVAATETPGGGATVTVRLQVDPTRP